MTTCTKIAHYIAFRMEITIDAEVTPYYPTSVLTCKLPKPLSEYILLSEDNTGPIPMLIHMLWFIFVLSEPSDVMHFIFGILHWQIKVDRGDHHFTSSHEKTLIHFCQLKSSPTRRNAWSTPDEHSSGRRGGEGGARWHD